MRSILFLLTFAISQIAAGNTTASEAVIIPDITIEAAAFVTDSIIVCSEEATPFCFSQDTVRVNEQVCVTAQANNFIDVTGFQFGISFDTSVLTYTGFTLGNIVEDLDSTDLNTDRAAGGILTMAYYATDGAPSSLEDGESVFTLCFTALSPGCHYVEVGDTLVGETLVSFADGTVSPYTGTPGVVTVLDCRDTTVTITATICDGNVFPFRGVAIANPGTYPFTDVTAEGCDSTTVLILLGNEVEFTLADSIGFCAGDVVQVNAPDSVLLGLATTPIDDLQPGIILQPGDNEVQLFEIASGCVKTQTVTVFAFENSQVEISGDLSYCTGEEGTMLVATGAETYMWSTGETSDTITATQGTVSVTGTDVNGCFSTAEVTVTIAPVPNARISGDLTYCAQDEGTELTANGGGTYEWSTREMTTTIIVGAGTYGMTVTNALGCQDTASVTVTTEAEAPEFITCPADITRAVNFGLTGIAISWQEPVVEDNCGPVGLAVESDLTNGGVFTLGDTTVAYTATDASGNTSSCTFSISVTESDELTFYVDSAGVTVDGDLFCIPVKVENFNEVAAFSVAFQLPAFEGVEFLRTDVGPELQELVNEGTFTGRNEVDGRTSVVFVNETGLGFTLADGAVAFNFKVRIPGGASDCFTVSPLFDYISIGAFREGPGRVVPSLKGGQACYPSEVNIVGRIYKCYDEQLPIGAADVLIGDSEGDDDFDITDAAGRYAFLEKPYGLDYTITPERDFDDADGLDIFDLLGLVRHIRGIRFITDPCMQIAADVNRSGSINLGDIPDVQELIVGNLNEFPENTSWRFVPTSFVFDGPALITPFPESAGLVAQDRDTIVDFYGIKIGDIDQSAIAQLTGIGEEETSFFLVEEQMITHGQRISVPIYYDRGQRKLAGLQQGWSFDTKRLRYASASAEKEVGGRMTVNHGLAPKGVIQLSWLDTELAQGKEAPTSMARQPVYYLEFDVLKTGLLSDALQPETDAFDNLAVTRGSTKAVDINVAFLPPSDSNELRFSVFPNPSHSASEATFSISSSAPWKMKVTDVLGRVTSEFSGPGALSEQNVVLPRLTLPLRGTYIAVLSTADGKHALRKIIKQ